MISMRRKRTLFFFEEKEDIIIFYTLARLFALRKQLRDCLKQTKYQAIRGAPGSATVQALLHCGASHDPTFRQTDQKVPNHYSFCMVSFAFLASLNSLCNVVPPQLLGSDLECDWVMSTDSGTRYDVSVPHS
jgi:hypothetical protein